MKDLDTPGKFMDELLKELTEEKCPFFDTVRARWATLFPKSPARPAKWENGRLFLYVRNAGALFAFRPKLPAVKKVLADLPGAPKPLKVVLEAHSACFSR